MLFAGLRSVRMVKNCDLGLENAARGLRPRAAFSVLSTNGIMEGKERQGKVAKVFSSSAEDKGYAKFKGRI